MTQLSQAIAKVLHVEDGAHSPWGPSAAHRWMNCPASVQATQDVPDEQTEYAASGTASHTLAQWCREQGARCEKFLGTILRVGKFDNLVDKARMDSVNAFLDYLDDLGGQQFCEARVQYADWVPPGFGTMDAGAVIDTVYHQIDFKDGEGVPVEAEDNEQLMLYMLGWYAEYGWMYPEVDTFVPHIVQPRLNRFLRGKPLTLEQLLTWAREKVTPAYEATLKEDAPYNPGVWCSQNFCRIRGSCRARARANLSTALEGFDSLETVQDKPLRDPARLTNDEKAVIVRMLGQIVKWAGELKSDIVGELLKGHKVGDCKMVPGRSSRVYTRAERDVVSEVLAYAFDNDLDIDKDDLHSAPELLSAAQLEKVVGKAAFAPAVEAEGKRKAKDAGALAHLIRKTEGRPTLAFGDDPRPAVAEEALKDFTNLDDVDNVFGF